MCVVTVSFFLIHYLCYRYSREEPFTALNVEIRNQQHLFESLDAFVKGDLLEGANAYHCEKCDKKVCSLLTIKPSTLYMLIVAQCKCLYGPVHKLSYCTCS